MANNRRILVVDSQVAGISGDMLMGALVDLGANATRISEAFKTVQQNLRGCNKLQIEVSRVIRKGISATKVDVVFQDDISERHATEIEDAILKTAESIGLSEKAKNFAFKTVRMLIEAEAKVHGREATALHFHEMGSADFVADVIGNTTALEDLGVFDNTEVWATPVAVGSGVLKFSHGVVPIPPPATLEILTRNKFPISNQSVTGELATPTGISLLVNLAEKISVNYPPIRPVAVGYGAGTKEFTEMPNVIRLTLGEMPNGEIPNGELLTDKVYVIETNVDDVPGEIIGYTVEKALETGARDVCIIPTSGKKNRPGQIIQIIADEDKVATLAQLLMEETGTIGVRFTPWQRYILERRFLPVEVSAGTTVGKVNVKVSGYKDGRVVRVKPEYQEAKIIAEKSGKPLREILKMAESEADNALTRENKPGH